MFLYLFILSLSYQFYCLLATFCFLFLYLFFLFRISCYLTSYLILLPLLVHDPAFCQSIISVKHFELHFMSEIAIQI